MLERVALHQLRFKTPGLRPDSRGVAIGHAGVLLFASLDRLVAFFSGYGQRVALDDLLASLKIRVVITPLRSREFLVEFAADSSYRMDQVASVAKLAGGLVFTGTSRHFVKYRDAGSPLGYDVGQLQDPNGDVVLYHDAFEQSYRYERELPFAELILKLQPRRVPRSRDRQIAKVWVSAELGIGDAVLSYLFRWRMDAQMSLAEWPPESAFEDRPKRLHLFLIQHPPARILQLLHALPGVAIFEEVTPQAAVQLDHEHPIDLRSCRQAFAEESLQLFLASGEVLRLDPRPALVPVASMVQARLDPSARAVGADLQAHKPSVPLQVELRLAPSADPYQRVIATRIAQSEREWLQSLLRRLPPRVLSALEVAASAEHLYVIDRDGIEALPLGRFFSEAAKGVYMPAGLKIVPALSPAILSQIFSSQGGHVFVDAGPAGLRATRLEANAFVKVSAQTIAAIPITQAETFTLGAGEALPLLRYGEPARFPLWGLPEEPAQSKALPAPK